jgi:hypothetical protein
MRRALGFVEATSQRGQLVTVYSNRSPYVGCGELGSTQRFFMNGDGSMALRDGG